MRNRSGVWVRKAAAGLAVWASLSHLPACRGCQEDADIADAGASGTVAEAPDPVRPLPADVASDPVAALWARTERGHAAGAAPARRVFCAQIRSLKDEAEAAAVATAITEATGLAVARIEKDLGERGIWHRLCVGVEETPARLIAAATGWTAPGGALSSFMDPPASPEEPRFHVLETNVAAPPPAHVTVAQASALLERSHDGGVAVLPPNEHPVVAATGPAGPALVDGDTAASRVVIVDDSGARVPVAPATPAGCASCILAEQQPDLTGTRRGIVSRRLLGSGPLLANTSTHPHQLLVEETAANGARFVTVLALQEEQTGLVAERRAMALLANHVDDVVLRGEAFVVEADGDDAREIAIARLALRRQGDNVCALERQAELWQPSADAARGLERLTLEQLLAQTAPVTRHGEPLDQPFLDYVTALDVTDDGNAAAQACAVLLEQRTSTLLTQLCLQRVRSLVRDGRLVDAVNAAGAIAERAPGLRPAVAAPLFSAMHALDTDPRLSAAPYDCEHAPLLAGLSKRTIDESIALARARLNERLSLADVSDAVFVTATRDFGPDTPVGAIAGRWLERLRVAQPARHAAIEAALLPPSALPQAAPLPITTPSPVDGSPGFGGDP